MKTILLICGVTFNLFICFSPLFAQNPEWLNYASGESITTQFEEGESIWVGTIGGLVKVNKTTNEPTFYNKGSGLPSNQIRAITNDLSGNLWVGTNIGLAKFNGEKWIAVNSVTDGLPSDDVQSMKTDKLGNIWVGTYSGLIKYDGHEWKLFTSSNSGLPDNYINTIETDFEGNIWVGTYNGLARFNGKTWTVFNTSNSELPDNIVYILHVDQQGYVWVGTHSGLAKFDGQELKANKTRELFNREIRTITSDKLGNLWIGLHWQFVKIDLQKNSYSFSNATDITSILADEINNIWIGQSTKGLTKFDGQVWTNIVTSNSGILFFESVFSAVVDANDNKWFGVWFNGTGGYLKIDGQTWTRFNNGNTGVNIGSSGTIIPDNYGNIWTIFDGINKYDGKSWTKFTQSNSQLPSNNVSSLDVDLNGFLWIGTDEGLVKFNGRTWTVFNSSNSQLNDNSILCLKCDSNGNIYMGTASGLSVFNGQSWKHYTSFKNVNEVDIDLNGIIWCLSGREELIKIENQFITIYNSSNSGFPNNDVRHLAVEKNGIVWIDGDGLIKFDGKNWTRYNNWRCGLSDNSICSIWIDKMGNKWIGTYFGGVSVFREGGVILDIQNPEPSIQKQLNLFQNYPNPFNPTTTIAFDLKVSGLAEVSVFNLLGSKVATIVNQSLSAGRHEFQFDASSFASGIYFYQVKTGGKTETKKMVLLK